VSVRFSEFSLRLSLIQILSEIGRERNKNRLRLVRYDEGAVWAREEAGCILGKRVKGNLEEVSEREGPRPGRDATGRLALLSAMFPLRTLKAKCQYNRLRIFLLVNSKR